MDASTMRERAATARAGRLATVRPDGRPHVVVCCFVLLGESAYSAIDDKPKTTTRLQRLTNIEANTAAALVVDHYDEDWTTLWWIRLDATARIVRTDEERAVALDGLTAKYAQYQHARPSGPVIALDVERWVAWP